MTGARAALGTVMTLRDKLMLALHHPITVEPTGARVTVRLGGRVVAETTDALTLREASYPPVLYVPVGDVDASLLRASSRRSYCPYKGRATHHSLQVGDHLARDAAWSYPHPHRPVAAIKGHVAFHPDKVSEIEVHRAA